MNKLYGNYSTVPVGVDPITEAIQILQHQVGHYYTYTPADKLGLEEGTDITEALATITENIGFKEGTWYVTGSVTTSANMTFADGATLVLSPGAVLTCAGEVCGGVSKIFDGGVVYLRGNSIVRPEWFGAISVGAGDELINSAEAIQKALNSIDAGTVILRAGKYQYVGPVEEYAPLSNCYYIADDTIEITGQHKALAGEDGNAIIFSSVVPAIHMHNAEGCSVHDVFLYGISGSSPDPAILVEDVTRSHLHDIRIMKHRAGILYKRTVNMLTERVEFMPTLDDSYSGNSYMVYLDQTPRAGLSPNASITFRGCLANFYNTSLSENCFGFIASGQDQRDIFIYDCEVAAGNGVWLDDSTVGMDVHIDRFICDMYPDFGIKTTGGAASMIAINGGYISGAPTATAGVVTAGTDNVTINGTQFQGDIITNNAFSAVRVVNAKGVSITGCTFLNCRKDIDAPENASFSVCGCVITTKRNLFTDNHLTNAIEIGAGCSAVINGNAFVPSDGYAPPHAVESASDVSVISNVLNGLDVHGSGSIDSYFNR